MLLDLLQEILEHNLVALSDSFGLERHTRFGQLQRQEAHLIRELDLNPVDALLFHDKLCRKSGHACVFGLELGEV